VNWVLDTNTLIYFFRGRGSVAHELLKRPPSAVAIPSIVLYELEVGIAKSGAPKKRQRQLETLLATVKVLPFGTTEAREASRIRVGLESVGLSIGPYDTLIAATAKARGATLVTHNVREFERVPGLLIEDWL